MCRTFPGRVRLQVGLSKERDTEGRLWRSSISDGPSNGIVATKRIATAEAEGGEEEQLAGGQTGGAAVFRTAMIRLMELEADVVFRKILEFL